MLPAVLAAMTLAALLVVVPPNATTVSVIGSPGTGAVLPANAAATVEGWWQQQANAQSSETLIESSAVSPATSPPADVPVDATPFDASGIDTQPGFEPNGGRYDQGVDAVLLGSDGRVVIGDGGLTVVRGADEASMTLQFVGADREVEPEFDNTDGPVTAALVMTVKSGVTTCDDANWTVDGTTLYAGPLGSTATSPILGSAVTGADPGDRVLPAGGSEVLCVNVTLPTGTTAGQGLSSTATLNFEAEQTANN